MPSINPIPFTKVQALGNDFVIVQENDIKDLPANLDKLAKALCDRHFGIGADGLIVVKDAQRSDCHFGWSFFNNDGSISAMCGNAIRCFALWAKTNNLINKNSFCVDTVKGKVEVLIESLDEITSDLGEPILDSKGIPVAGEARAKVMGETLNINGQELNITCVGMGNPHCVIFNSNLSQPEQLALSPLIQSHPFFPEGVNIEFARIIDSKNVEVFVVERAVGPTLACASGAAATLVAGVLQGHLDRSANIKLPGGELFVNWLNSNNHVLITGPARVSYQGSFDSLALANGFNGKKME